MSKLKNFTCQICNKSFTSYNVNASCCSLSCANKYRWQKGTIGLKKRGTTKECLLCKKQFYTTPSSERIKCCSQSCAAKYRYHVVKNMPCVPFPKSKNLPKKVYKMVHTNGESFLEHRLIIERVLARKLLSTEEVHHIDFNHLNNSLSNLKVMSRTEHRRLHAIKKLNL